MSWQVLVTPRSFGSTSTEPLSMLEGANCHVTRLQRQPDGQVSSERMCRALSGMDALIVGLEPLSNEVFDCATDLRVISKYGVGLDNIDLAAARRRHIPVGWTPGANSNAVAEMTLALMYGLARHLPQIAAMLREGRSSRRNGVELRGRTLGILGLGRIGNRVAQLGLGIGMDVIVHDPYFGGKGLDHISLVPLPELYQRADVVSLHVPLTSETQHLVDRDALEMMKPGAFLINTARGEIVDEEALLIALEEGQIAGVAIDCFSREPAQESPLLELDNVIGTPHVASHTVEAVAAMGRMASENVIAGLKGEPLPHPCPLPKSEKE